MNRLFVAYKPKNITSNSFLSQLKRRYNIKKIGYSGTLDPFATGSLIIATGEYTKLFQFLKKSPKKYRATLWLGAESETLDIEKIQKVETIKEIKKEKIEKILNSMIGEIEYYPPKYSAKKINGKRAYNLARKGVDVELKKIKSEIYNIKLLSYRHPFLTFEIVVSEGSYIRSFGEIIANRLGVNGILSMLERVSEGDFIYQNEKPLNPIKYLNIEKNIYLKDETDIIKGVKLNYQNFKIQKEGRYYLEFKKSFSIIEIKKGSVKYLVNNISFGMNNE